MSIIENLRRGDGDEAGGGKFNPFRILEIGESMVRYCDGIRIKNYNFLAILTSDRLVLIESAQQSAGTIAKEIPVSMIQGAVMERDEKNRPSLAVSMEVGGQTRLMKLVFTGLIAEPETECREWFAAINGYPPEPELNQEPELPVAPEPTPEPIPVSLSPPGTAGPLPVPAPAPVPSPIIDAEAVSPVPKTEEIQEQIPAPVQLEPAPTPVIQYQQEPVSPPAPVGISPEVPEVISPAPKAPVVDKAPESIPQKTKPIPKNGKQRISVPAPGTETIQISLEKPNISPLRFKRRDTTPVSGSSGKPRYCMHCGSRFPAVAKFCPVCGKTQV